MPISLAHKMSKKLTEVRKDGVLDYLNYDYDEDGEISDEEFYGTLDYVMGTALPISSMLNGKYIIGNHRLHHKVQLKAFPFL